MLEINVLLLLGLSLIGMTVQFIDFIDLCFQCIFFGNVTYLPILYDLYNTMCSVRATVHNCQILKSIYTRCYIVH